MGERADAVRNRAVILDAAEALFRRADLDHVSLERIAHAAGVGKATVMRRFG
ncbi:TetR family transcriptional regulator, partial [Micromonospora arborensis]|uniref:TetR family transcriptional regulator n=1 Tax=Micromonospora arborensis TaxID=2116518 RepID=UPI003424D16B